MADYNAKGLQDKDNNNLNFTPTHFMDAQGNSKSIEVEFGKKQNTLSLEADNADINDSTTIVKTLDGTKLKTALAVKLWNYIKGKLGFDSNTSRYGISISGTASSADKLNNPTAASTAITGKENAGGYLSRAYQSGGYPTQFGNVFTIGGAGGSQLFLAWSGSKKGIAKIYYRNRRDVEMTDGDCWSDWKALAWEDHTHTKSQISDFSHNHDDRYYTETEIDTLIGGKSPTSHTHSVSINGSTKTIAASGGTAVDLGTYKVFNYARMFPMQAYNANTNRYILLASKAATYTHNWEESSMFKLVVHAGQVPKELVFRLWVYGYVSSGTVPSDPSNPKLYRLCAENFSESELGILDVRLFVGEKSAGSITFTIGIFIDRNYLQGPHISYQLYPLSCETRDRGDVIDNGLSTWTYTVGHDIYSDLHNSFTTAFDVSELPIRMNVVDAYELEYLTGPITSLNPLKLPSNIICPDGYAPRPDGSYIALSQFVQNKTHRFELWQPMSESVWLYNNLGVTIVYRTVSSSGFVEYDVLPQEVIILNRGGNRVKPTSAWATLIDTNLYVTFGY